MDGTQGKEGALTQGCCPKDWPGIWDKARPKERSSNGGRNVAQITSKESGKEREQGTGGHG